MSTFDWKTFLDELNHDIITHWDGYPEMPSDVLAIGWIGFPPASEEQIEATELRLDRPLPPSLRDFYKITNGWGIVGCFIWNVLPVEQIGWLSDLEPDLLELAAMAESEAEAFF